MYKLLSYDKYLKDYAGDIDLRMSNYEKKRAELLKNEKSLKDFANGHHYFGIHRMEDGSTVYREWAPGASAMYLYGDFNGWNRTSHPLKALKNGVWEIVLPKENGLKNGQKYKALVTHNGVTTEHIPSYANYVTQDPVTYVWSSEVHFSDPYEWKNDACPRELPPLIYECHIGMAQEESGVGSYASFTENVLPRIHAAGYNTIQIMAIMEHPYYASFGYQVSNFFAASSRYGTPEDLKALIDAAHGMGIRVLLDVVHSHAIRNESEGLNRFDGTNFQYFHEGPRGDHSAWGTKLFNYGKNEVIHFLLSNLKFWMEEFHFDGFRFDGVTSMLYHDHGLGTSFDNYSKYFSLNTDTEAVTYLMLANELIHELDPKAVTIAEDMSGMPGMCVAIEDGGVGFDYRLAMGVPDFWIRTLKERRDEDWDLWQIWYELSGRRPHEKNIGYAESHDQALVGDKTIMFRLCDAEMYTGMSNFSKSSLVIDRGIALHKLIRLMTFSLAGEGYLNFMGNEFGHPEWIDFPREGNGWSYQYCRRQWHLVDDGLLKYRYLAAFDKAMLNLQKEHDILSHHAHNLWMHQQDKVMVYEKGGDVFAFNLNPTQSFSGYFVPVRKEGDYEVILSSDDESFGGYGRIDKNMVYHAETVSDDHTGFFVYLPSRTAVVFRKK